MTELLLSLYQRLCCRQRIIYVGSIITVITVIALVLDHITVLAQANDCK